jgi:hypothetical protein
MAGPWVVRPAPTIGNVPEAMIQKLQSSAQLPVGALPVIIV